MPSPKQLWPVLKQAASDFFEDKAPKLAAALAYYTVISLAPLLIVTVLLLGFIFGQEAASGQVSAQIENLTGHVGGDALEGIMKQAGERKDQSTFPLIFSLVLLILGASGVFGELQDSLNTIWEVKPKPGLGVWGWIRTRFLSMAAVLGIAFLLLVSLFVSTVVAGVSGRVMGAVFGDGMAAKAIGIVIDILISTAVVTVLFAAMFKLLPDVQIHWRDVWTGALLTAVLFQLGKYGLSWYLGKGSATSNFGPTGSAVASFVALLIWVYYSGWILFYGAEFTQAYATAFGSKIVPSKHAEPMTAEARAQMGMEQKPTRSDTRGEFRGALPRPPQRQAAPGRRQVVTIEQPSQMNRKGYWLAAGGVAAGAVLGAAGVLTGRKWGEPRLSAVQINQRLNALEQRVAMEKSLKRYGRELTLAERVAQIEQRVSDAAKSLKQTIAPPWYAKLTRPRQHHKPSMWYSRIKQYVS